MNEECHKVLDELLEKYPQSSKDILITLKDIAREYELWEKRDKNKNNKEVLEKLYQKD